MSAAEYVHAKYNEFLSPVIITQNRIKWRGHIESLELQSTQIISEMSFGAHQREDDNDSDIECPPLEGTPTKRGSFVDKESKIKKVKSTITDSNFWLNPIVLFFIGLLIIALMFGIVFGLFSLILHLA